MTHQTKINYTFHNEEGETVDMTFTILQIEGMVGGFMKHVQKQLDEIEFGNITKVYRTLLL